MPKTKISEFSATPGNNTDIDGINIAEGCAPSGINDAIRELMAQLKDFQAGTAGDSFNGPVGTTTAAAGAFTTLSASSTVSGAGFSTYLASPPAIGGTAAAAGSFTTLSASSSVTLSGGTANGVAYLNGSKVLTTGSALQFSGTYLQTLNGTGIQMQNSGATANWFFETSGLNLSFTSAQNGAAIWSINGSEQARLTSTGLGIGTTSINSRLVVQQANNTGDGIRLFANGNDSQLLTRYVASIDAWQVSASYASTGGYKPIAFFTSDVERARITSGGDLLVGTTTNTYSSKIVSNSGITDFGTQYNVNLSGADYQFVQRGANRGFAFYVDAAGTVATLSSAGVWTDASDARYKENVQPTPYGLDAVMQLKPREYNLIGQSKKQVGFIAQEVLDVVPEVVDSVVNSITNEDRYTLSYGQMTAVLTKAIQELKAQNDELRARVAALETK